MNDRLLSFLNGLVAPLTEFAAWFDDKLQSPEYLKVLLGFWISIGFCGFALTVITFFRPNVIVLSIGLLDVVLALIFAGYYYTQVQQSKGKHQKPE